MIDPWPLVGRDPELAYVLERLGGPVAAGVVIAGESGVGKTRLAAEVRQRLEQAGIASVRVAATRAAASIPFGALAPLLPRVVDRPDDLLDLFTGAATALAELAAPLPGPRGRPGAGPPRLGLFVDDAHLLDDASAALVLQVAAQPWCRLVATIRSGEPAPDAIVALWKDGLADRLELSALSPADSETLIDALLTSVHGASRPVAAATVERLLERSGGNALYLRELVVGLVEAGALEHDQGLWRLRGAAAAPVRLVELVQSRLEGLDEGGREVVEFLAVAEGLGLELLESIVGSGALAAVEGRGVIDVTFEDRRQKARLAHPLYGEVVRRRLGPLRDRTIRRALAEAVRDAGARRREDVLQVGAWQLDAGIATDGALLLDAARQAQMRFDANLTERLAAAARQAGAGVPAGLLTVEAYFEQGRAAEAETLLAVLEGEATTDDEIARVANARAHNLMNGLNRADAAVSVLEAAMARVGDAGARHLLSGRLAILQLFAANPRAVVDAAADLLQSDDDATVVRSAYAVGIALAELGRYRSAIDASDLGYHTQLTHQHVSVQPAEVQRIAKVLALADAGRLGEAAAVANEAHRAVMARGNAEAQATFAMLRGLVAVGAGDLPAADRAFREGAAVNRDLNDTLALCWCLGGLAMVAGMGGDTAAAREAVRELDELGPMAARLLMPELVWRGRAWAMVARGEFTAARHALSEGADEAAASGLLAIAMTLLHDVVRLGDPSVAPALATLRAEVDPDAELPAAYVDHAAAVLAGDPAAVERSGASFANCGALLLAAEAYAEASALYRAASLARAATAAHRRSSELAARCGRPHTPALTEVDEVVGELTSREREIAVMAAGGLVSKEIAARLSVAVRTVDNHLQRVYVKLGVNGREELASRLDV